MTKSAARLPAAVLSAQDVQALILEVRQYAKWLSHSDIKQRVTAQTDDQTPTFSTTVQEVIAAAGNPTDPQALEVLLADLEDIRTSAPQLTITLAAPAGGELKRSLAAWCRSNIASDVLVSFQFNSTILGGMVVRCGSRVFDWSFRRQILNNRQTFPQVLRDVR